MPKRATGTGEGKRAPLNMRTTQDLRDRLEAAATLSGRSLAQEVEARLQRSFVDEEQQGGPYLAALGRMVLNAIQLTEHLTGKGWLDDPDTREACAAAVNECMMSFDKGPLSREAVLRRQLRSDEAITLAAKAKAAASVALHRDELQNTMALIQALTGEKTTSDEGGSRMLLGLVQMMAQYPGGASKLVSDLSEYAVTGKGPKRHE